MSERHQGGGAKRQPRGVVALIDPRALTRQCLTKWLEACGLGVTIVAVASLDELSERLAAEDDLDLVIMSIGGAMVTDAEVAGTLERLARMRPEVPAIILSDRDDVCAILAAIRRGVRGYIPTTLNLPVAVQALRLVRVGGTFVPAASFVEALGGQDGLVEHGLPDAAEDATRSAGTSSGLPGMTPRQSEVLDLLRQGKSNKIIAYELAMQESTVKVHIRHIMRKLKATNRTQAAYLAQQLMGTVTAGNGALSTAEIG